MPKANVRDKIVQAAHDLFHARGFNATGVQDIVDAAGVPKGSFYNHFQSKEALAAVALEHYLEMIASPVLHDDGLLPRERIRAHFSHLAELAARHGYANGCMVGNFSTELPTQCPEVRARLAAAFAEWAGQLADTLSLVPGVSCEAGLDRAYALIYAWEGALMHARVTGDGAPMRRFFDDILANIA